MARSASESLELSEVNFSKTRSVRLFLTNDYKVNQLFDFGFTKRVDTRPMTPKLVST